VFPQSSDLGLAEDIAIRVPSLLRSLEYGALGMSSNAEKSVLLQETSFNVNKVQKEERYRKHPILNDRVDV
jgi:hypothetical protein